MKAPTSRTPLESKQMNALRGSGRLIYKNPFSFRSILLVSPVLPILNSLWVWLDGRMLVQHAQDPRFKSQYVKKHPPLPYTHILHTCLYSRKSLLSHPLCSR